ncbi:bacteriocin immunity protein [Escherichia coli]
MYNFKDKIEDYTEREFIELLVMVPTY